MIGQGPRMSRLQGFELFADSTDAELRKAESLLTEVTIPAGKVLVQEGRYGADFIIIAEGMAVVTTTAGLGQRVLANVGPGDFVGEISLLQRTPRSATVTAITPLTAFVCNPAEFRSLLHDVPSFADKVTRVAESRLEENRQEEEQRAA
jgi:protein lysine acetyltransferase